jgi:hypothetical protein
MPYVPETPQQRREHDLAQIRPFLLDNPHGSYDDFCSINPCLAVSRFKQLAAVVRVELALDALQRFVDEEDLWFVPVHACWLMFKLWQRSAQRPGPRLGFTRFRRLMLECFPDAHIDREVKIGCFYGLGR